MLAYAVAILLSAAQPGPTILMAADRARTAFLEHDFRALFEKSAGVLIHLPGEPAGRQARGGAAAASLSALVRGMEEQEVVVERARVVERQFGYIELRRTFHLAGVEERQVQRILLSVRLIDGDWRVTELLVVKQPVGRSSG